MVHNYVGNVGSASCGAFFPFICVFFALCERKFHDQYAMIDGAKLRRRRR
jgi:hypothetical protein